MISLEGGWHKPSLLVSLSSIHCLDLAPTPLAVDAAPRSALGSHRYSCTIQATKGLVKLPPEQQSHLSHASPCLIISFSAEQRPHHGGYGPPTAIVRKMG